MNELLKGAYDFHIHTSPDVSPRRCSDLELAARLQAAGMKGAVLKCHFGDTAARAATVQTLYPEMNFAGGVVLNRQAGGLNPAAVEASGKMGGKLVWFPTLESRSYQAFHKAKHPEMDLSPMIAVLDEEGKLLPAAVAVLDAAARYNMIVATGHISAEEGMALVREGARRGCRMLLTHADLPSNRYSTEQLLEAVSLGATVEHCYFTIHYQRTELSAMAEQIRAVGCEHVILSTDFGQVNSPYSDEGMELFVKAMTECGFTPAEIALMVRENPERLLAGK